MDKDAKPYSDSILEMLDDVDRRNRGAILHYFGTHGWEYYCNVIKPRLDVQENDNKL